MRSAFSSLAAALAEIERIADERQSLEIRLYRALGDESAALALERENELSGIDESNHALLQRIWALEVAKGGLAGFSAGGGPAPPASTAEP